MANRYAIVLFSIVINGPILKNNLTIWLHWAHGKLGRFAEQSQLFLKNGPNPASFFLFLLFQHDKYTTNFTINDKSIVG